MFAKSQELGIVINSPCFFPPQTNQSLLVIYNVSVEYRVRDARSRGFPFSEISESKAETGMQAFMLSQMDGCVAIACV